MQPEPEGALATSGERWTRALLVELRQRRYRAAAWRAFVALSLERARENRSLHARAHRETSVLALAGCVGFASVAVAGLPWVALAGAGWWLVLVVMVDWHLGMLEGPDGTRLPGLGTPNLLALGRAALVPVVPFVLGWHLVILLVLAATSDVADGWLARRRSRQSRLGAWLDGMADTLLLVMVSAVAFGRGLLPWWAAALALTRLLLPWLLISCAYFLRGGPVRLCASRTGHAAGVVLFAGLVLSAAGVAAGAILVVLGSVAGASALAVSARQWTARLARLDRDVESCGTSAAAAAAESVIVVARTSHGR